MRWIEQMTLDKGDETGNSKWNERKYTDRQADR
jgi:hypothetical protein